MEIVREDCGDREIPSQISTKIMSILEKNKRAAYLVYLNLCKTFGTGKGLE